jgi:RNA polymerase sigma-70 factor (ECF subfamily)
VNLAKRILWRPPTELEELDDSALTRAASTGDGGAFDELMRRHERLIFTVAFRFCRDRDTALDLTQTVFLKAWRGLGEFRGDSSLKTWLLRIAYREASDARRRQAPLDLAEPLEPDAGPTQAAVQEDVVLRRERSGRLRRALDAIHHRYRQAIELRYGHQLSIREISAILETSETMTKNLLFRGLERLRRALEAETIARRRDA